MTILPQHKIAENIPLLLITFVLLLITSGCSSNKFLGPEETFLKDNYVRIRSDERVENKAALRSELSTLYQQQATRTFFGIPRHWFYYRVQKKDDTTGLVTKLWANIADDPVILDTAKIYSTGESMVRHMRQRGYWDATVDWKINNDGKHSWVTYTADPQHRWTVSSIRYVSRDSSIQQILGNLTEESLLAPGAPVDFDLFTEEKNRITLALQNRGYANFFSDFIAAPIVDTSGTTMDLEIEILLPQDAAEHRKFSVGKISVYTDALHEGHTITDTTIQGMRFTYPGAKSFVRRDIIRRNIHLRTGEIYSRDNYDKTLRQLSRLDAYRFVSIRPEIDSDREDVLNYQITMTRNLKMAIGGDVEMSYSSLALSRRSLLGAGINLNYRNRNLLRGAELFTTNLETGVEVNIGRSRDSRFNSGNLSIQNSLQIPKFIDPFRLFTTANSIRIGRHGVLGDKVFGWLSEGNSQINAGYQYSSIFNFYDYHSFNAGLGYNAQPDPRRRLQITHLGLDFFSPSTKPAFEDILRENTFLRESFGKQLFTGLILRDYRMEFRSGVRPRRKHSVTTIHSAEISGLEVLGINSLYNLISGKTGAFSIGRDNPVAFSHFAKFELDVRYHYHLASTQMLAVRAAAGVASSFGPFSPQVPYVRQFHAGGPLSLRAWRIRELGPGGYEDTSTPLGNVQFYQTGDVKLEVSAEYRFDIAWAFKGALFLDAGNVWTIREDADRPGAVFSFGRFLDQIAVGTGAGLRMDFTYFVIRLDFGYKLRNPYPDEMGRQWLFHHFKDFSLRQITTNFAIGYPF